MLTIRRVLSILLPASTLFVCSAAPAQQVLTLEQCLQMATVRNNNITVAERNIEAAKAQKAQADVKGKPVIDGSVMGFYFGDPLNKLLPEYGISPGIAITQPVYTGGKIKLGQQAAAKGIEITEEQKKLAVSDVILQTENAYWQLVSVKEKIKLAEQFHLQLGALHTELSNAYLAGLIYKNDVLRVEVQQNENALNLLKAKDGLTLAKLQLAQLIGAPDSTHFTVADSVSGAFGIQPDPTLQQALNNRSEIKILQRAIESGKIQEKLLRADSKPAVGLSLNGITAFGKQGINPGSSSNFLGTYYGLVNVSIPIFDWGAKKQKVKQQQFTISAQETKLKEAQELIALEVQQAFLQLNQSAQRIELSGTSLTQANENLKLSNDRFKAGTITGKDVLEAQTIWQQAYSNIIDARVAYRVNEARLRKALGETK